MKNRTVLISGASIAGPTLAYWLVRYGFHVTLVERAPGLRLGGQAVDLRGTARQVAERMGLLPQIRAAHTGAVGMSFVDGHGEEVARLGGDLFGDSGGPIAEIEILRGDLVQLLYGSTRDAAEYLFNDSIQSLTEDADGVRVTFERSPPRRFDLVIGADGVHSRVRELAFGAEERFVKDLGAFSAIYTAPTDLALNGWGLVYTLPGAGGAPGKSVGLYPVKDKPEAKAMFHFSAPLARYDRRDAEQHKRLVAQAFAEVRGWEVPALLDAMWDAPDFYFDRVAQVRMEAWSRGRVALLGDAAYCASLMAGSGSSLAMVSAYVLAGELARWGEDFGAAFAAYEAKLRPYATACQALAKDGNDAMLPRSRWRISVRNLMLRLLPYLPGKALIARKVERMHLQVALEDYAPAALRAAA